MEPHHIIPCHPYDELFLDLNNGVVLCSRCHSAYHNFTGLINQESLDEFKQIYKPKPRPKKKKSKKKIKRKAIKPTKPKKVTLKPAKKPKKKKKIPFRKLLVPIVTEELGTDDWEYMQKMELEREVLGDY